MRCRWRPSHSWTRGRACRCSTTTVCGRCVSRRRHSFTSTSTRTSRAVTTTARVTSATSRVPNTSPRRPGTTSRCGSSHVSSRPSSPYCTSLALPRDVITRRDVIVTSSCHVVAAMTKRTTRIGRGFYNDGHKP